MNNNIKSEILFNPNANSEVLEDLLYSFQENCFRDSPPIPNVIEREEVGEFKSETTSSGASLNSKAFVSPPVHIPNSGEGEKARHSFKTELSLLRDPNVGTKKILRWHDADPRQLPHNHPWDFRSAILAGGYTEERFFLKDGIWVRELVEYEAGSVNIVPADVFHNVIDVQEGTVTFLDCGKARQGNEWGYLDVEENEYFDWKKESPTNFLEIFKSLNAH